MITPIFQISVCVRIVVYLRGYIWKGSSQMASPEKSLTQNEGEMDKEELGDAVIQGDLPNTKPEDSQDLRDCACGEDNVFSRQHAEEEVHGFMKAPFHEDNEDQQAVPKQGDDIGNEEGIGDPHMLVIKAWVAQQAKDCVANTSVV